MNERFILEYISDISDIARKAREIERINQKAARKLGKDFTGAIDIVSRRLERIKEVPIKVDGKDSIKQLSTFSTVVRDANGKLFTFRETMETTNKGTREVSNTFSEGAKTARSFGDNISTLLKRAALTIPVWFAIRQGIGSIFRTIRDGFTDLVSFERSLAKISQNLLATSQDVTKDLGILRKEFVQLAIDSGVSTDKIANAFQKFVTVGFNFEDAMAGAVNSTKLAVTLFGDAEETANAFSRALRVLVDESEGASDSADQIAESMALTSQLWKTNQFDINEVNQALEKFAPAANSANLSMQETLTLLATLGTAATGGARGGTLLRTTFLKLLSNLDEVSKALGINITQFDTSFTIIGKVIDKLDEMGGSLEGVTARSEVVAEVFGGVRSALPLQSLTALNDVFKENARLLPDVQQFGKEFEDLSKTLPILTDRFKVLNVEIGKSFVTGIIGGEDFEDTLEKIIELQEKLQKEAEKTGAIVGNSLGLALQAVGAGVAFKGIEAGVVRLATAFGVTLPAGLVGATAGVGKFAATTTAILTKLFKFVLPLLLLDAISRFKFMFEKELPNAIGASQKKFTEVGKELHEGIIKGFAGQLNKKELEDLIGQIEVFRGTEALSDTASTDRALERLKIELEIAKEKEKQLKTAKEQAETETKSNRNLRDINNSILQDAQARLQAQGAIQSQMIKQELALRKQFDLELQGKELLDKKLQLERAINEERRLSADLSSDTVKLFRIAQEEGTGVAKAIGDVLSGQIDFNSFVRRGGKEVEILKKEFGDIFEQQQAKSFFRGESIPGLQGLRGGRSIDIQEEAIRRPDRQFDASAAVRQRAILREQDSTPTINNTTATQENTKALIDLRNQIAPGDPGRTSVNTQIAPGVFAPTNTRQMIDLNVNVDGTRFDFSGDASTIRTMAAAVSKDVAKAVEEKLVNDIANKPQSPSAQAVTKRQFEN